MSTPVIERVDEWGDRPFTGGYGQLQDLADAGFSGVVKAGGAELYMTRGTVVGVRNGTIEAFEDADGTVHDAPTAALPLLAVMQERSTDARAQYYSEDTSIAEVDTKLEGGGFTGYIELSENVLSGDYYIVYHQGQSMSVAFVGNAEKLLKEEEAFDRANGEVGIYKVYPVDIQPIEIPDPTSGESSAAGATADTEPVTDDIEGETDGAEESAESGAEQSGDSPPGQSAAQDDEDSSDVSSEAATTATTATEEPTAENAPVGTATGDPSERVSTTVDDRETDTTATGGEAERRPDTTETQTAETDDGHPSSQQGNSLPQEDTHTDQRDETGQERDDAVQNQERPGRDRDKSGRTREKSGRTQEERGRSREDTDRARDRPGQAREEPGRAQGGSQSRVDESERGQRRREQQSREGRQDRRERGRRHTPDEPRETDPVSTDRRTGDNGAAHADRATPDRDHQAQPPAGGEQPRTPEEVDSSGVQSPDTTRGSQSPTAGAESGHNLETKAIPSLDPERTESGDTDPDVPQPQEGAQARTDQVEQEVDETTSRQPSQPPQEHRPVQEETPERAVEQPQRDEEVPATGAGGSEQSDTPIEQLEAEIDDREYRIEELEQELEVATDERDRLQSELEAVRKERDELAAEVERLESKLDRLETELGAATDHERRITPAEALDGTDIFVRYHSKGQATLEKAHGGKTQKSEVVENIRLEKHTQFDADSVAVGGQTYAEFLESTNEYRFVEWMATELLFEIRDTGHADALKTLYDAVPKIDRAELNGSVDIVYTEDGQENRSSERFDIVLRDRMGDPLVVANLNDSREAATESMMEDLITSAELVGKASDDFAGAFLVTESFFEPGALETASEATRGGLLSRNKQKSFVNLSRKRGYHLCLVEARNEKFNLTVPEL